MHILAILFTVVRKGGGGGDGSNHSIHKSKGVGPQSTMGVGSNVQGGQYLGCKVTVL